MEKKIHSVTIWTLSFLLLCLSTLYASELDHHGMAVDSEGSADYCLTCHDGKTAKKVPVCTTTCNINAHKFLVKYPPPGREKEFAPQASILTAGIKLENGMITCISCHDLHNPLKYHFAVDAKPYAQKLCYVCHIKID